MSDIVLSASVRQNLLSLQSTASLLSTTQNDLATGKSVNSALDNPTNYFTAASLDDRASDINNLLDSIGNGVQVLQSANTGITSLENLVASAKSVANQVLQAPTGYSAKSNVSAAITGATANNLLGTAATAAFYTSSGGQNDAGSPYTLSTQLVSFGQGNSTPPADTWMIATGETLNVNGKTITFSDTATTNTTDGSGNVTIGVGVGSSETLGDLLGTIDSITGATGADASTVTGGTVKISTGTTQNLVLNASGGGNVDVQELLGLSSSGPVTTDVGGFALQGKTLTIGATGGGTATSITFGTSAGQVNTLNGLNAKLAANNLQATIDSSGNLSITTTNDAASSTIGALGGTATASGLPFNGLTVSAAVADPDAQATRASLVAQYNNILDQITSTAQDSSFNGINLLNGDQLKLTFNETGTSTLSIQGVTFDAGGLGLSKLTTGTDFLDNSSANTALTNLDNADSSLRSEASALGSNLSIVQIRQDFSKSLINVLQTGSSNLTLADTNELAADSQALSTRQSIAVSALSLANQSQQSVLQLLR